MSQQVINNGLFAGDQSAEPFFTAWGKVNSNFTDVYGQIAAIIAAGSTGITGFSLTGDVTGTYASGSVPTTISAGAVTFAKMANLAASSLIGNNTGGSATPVAIGLGQGLSFNGATVQIANSAITLAMLANETASTILGNPTGSPAAPSAITLGATLAFSGSALQTAALTGDCTASANSFATTVGKIQGNAILAGTPTNNQALIWNNGASQWQATSRPFDVTVFAAGVLTASQVVARVTFNRSVQFPASLTGSNATAEAASTGTATLNIQKNGTNVGTVVYTTSATATFTMGSQTTFNAGDVMRIVGPGSADATLAGVAISLAGVLV